MELSINIFGFANIPRRACNMEKLREEIKNCIELINRDDALELILELSKQLKD